MESISFHYKYRTRTSWPGSLFCETSPPPATWFWRGLSELRWLRRCLQGSPWPGWGECFWNQGMKLFIFPFISIYFFNRDATVNLPARLPSKDSPWGAADWLTPPHAPETLPVPKGSRKLLFENAHVGLFSNIFWYGFFPNLLYMLSHFHNFKNKKREN